MAQRVLRLAARTPLRLACARASGGGCSARPPPPCAPCRPAPQPACRARPPAVRRAQRVVCCAPPQGARPPCAAREPACPLTCEHSEHPNRKTWTRQQDELAPRGPMKGSDCERDPVAKRISLARRARRADYECEVERRAARQRAAGPPPPVTFHLSGERECARATDGCLYAMPRVGTGPRTRCGPGRVPPPPRCVELAPDDGCRIKGDAHLDPCAHRPRVMIEIDRSANSAGKTAPDAPSPAPLPPPARRSGATSWCDNPPQPAPAPQRCRPPTIVERLRARSKPRLPDSRDERRLHTSAVLSKTAKSCGSRTSSLEGLLQSKENLKEAGRGRIVVDAGAGRARAAPTPGGGLELRVPPGTERVAVRVSLEGGAGRGPCKPDPAPAPAPLTTPASACVKRKTSPCDSLAVLSGKREPWISIKNIQKKFPGCRSCDGLPGGKRAPGAGVAPRGQRGRREPPPCSSTSAYLANTIIVN